MPISPRMKSRRARHLLAWVLVWAILGAMATVRTATAQTAGIDPADLATFLDEFVPAHLDEHHIPGVTLSVVQGDRILLSRGYGYANVEQRAPVDPTRTLFRTGSVGKLITWTAVMQLVEQGRLDLHVDVNDYLDFTIPAAFDAPITLAHLMTHTPGFADAPDGLFALSAEEVPPLAEYLRIHLPERVFPPGEVQAYSNYGSALAGYIVERVSGRPFVEYAEAHIFAPLGMTHSTVRQPVPADWTNDLATGYAYHDGAYLPGGFIFVGPYPAGNMSTTAEDMAAFMLAHLNQGQVNGYSLLRPETVAEMQSHQYAFDPRMHGIAYGWMEQRLGERRVLQHRGSILQFNAGMYLLPEESLGLFFSYNGRNGGAVNHVIWNAMVARYYPTPPIATALAPPADASLRLAPLLGEYHMARGQFSGPGQLLNVLSSVQIGATPDGYLTMGMEGAQELFVEIEPGLFRRVAHDGLLAFRQDAAGRQWMAVDGELPFPHLTATAAFRAPWYNTLPVAALLLVGTLLGFLISIIWWLIVAVGRRLRRSTHATPLRPLGWAAVTFGLVLLAFLVEFVLVVTDLDPRYGVPTVVFGDTPGVIRLGYFPWGLLLAGIALVGLTARAWLTRAGSVLGRLHHSLLSLAAVVLVARLWMWGFLG